MKKFKQFVKESLGGDVPVKSDSIGRVSSKRIGTVKPKPVAKVAPTV